VERHEAGGLGYLKEFRVLRDSSFLCVADRAILSCWGLRGGKAGAPFKVTVDPGGPNERVLPGLVDDEPIPAGTLVRVETTGGGGWGDPLERESELVALDALQGKISANAAREEYGVVLAGSESALRAEGEPESTPPRPERCASAWARRADTNRSSIAGPAIARSPASITPMSTSWDGAGAD
jgi:N-methylhydantoinase B